MREVRLPFLPYIPLDPNSELLHFVEQLRAHTREKRAEKGKNTALEARSEEATNDDERAFV